MAEKFKYVTIKEREYQIGKFGARDGAFIAIKLGGILAPMIAPLLKGIDPKKVNAPTDLEIGNLDVASLMAPLANISEGDFSYLQEKSLQVCRIKMPAGWINVLQDNGTFSVAELEDDSASVMSLMVHALIHNLSGFFDGSPLSGFLGGLLATNPQG